ncbi:conserved hypothetical protein [gamma proteobacterium HdN1]|nr:conserved hypothetical protein [gamma proteobacterium HdN1]
MVGDKTAILDIRARTDDGRDLNIEMQIVNSGSFIHRTLYYWSEMYGENLHAGEGYDVLRQTITINLLDFKLFDRKRMISLYQLKEHHDNAPLTDLMQVYFLELPKLGREPIPPPLQAWMQFLTTQDHRLLEQLSHTSPAIAEALDMLNYISQDQEERRRHLSRKIALLDQKTLENRVKKAEERAKGLEERAKGLSDENKELRVFRDSLKSVTHKLLEQRFGPLPDWAKARLEAATAEQLGAIGSLVISAERLENCFL